jgi:pilus assembly protein CpaB
MEKAKNLVAQLRQDRKILWIAVASGVLAAMLLYFYLQNKKEPYGRLVPILVAKNDIPKGASFSEESFREEHRPEAFVSAEFVGIADLNLVAGKKTVISIPAGQPILWQYIHLEEGAASLSKGLNAQFNERAVAITVDEIRGVGGHLQPNDRVDVIGTFVMPGAAADGVAATKTKVILECVTVAAVGSLQSAQPNEDGAREMPASVTLKVTPEEAALLVFAESVGQLRLVLRNPDDIPNRDQIAKPTSAIEFSDLFKTTPVSEKRIRIIYGTNHSGTQ